MVCSMSYGISLLSRRKILELHAPKTCDFLKVVCPKHMHAIYIFQMSEVNVIISITVQRHLSEPTSALNSRATNDVVS